MIPPSKVLQNSATFRTEGISVRWIWSLEGLKFLSSLSQMLSLCCCILRFAPVRIKYTRNHLPEMPTSEIQTFQIGDTWKAVKYMDLRASLNPFRPGIGAWPLSWGAYYQVWNMGTHLNFFSVAVRFRTTCFAFTFWFLVLGKAQNTIQWISKGPTLIPFYSQWAASLSNHCFSLSFSTYRVAVEVVTTMTSADVMWQDGTVETNIRSNELIPVHHLDNNEFCPGDFVVDKRGIGWKMCPLEDGTNYSVESDT